MKLKFLGTGTSQGIPVIGSHHPVCLSDDFKDKRLRTSALITTDTEKKILIDCGPDFRQQMLVNHEEDVHSVLITHEHNDHIIGLDDLRPLIFKNNYDMPLYCMERVAGEIRSRFPYAFEEQPYPGAPVFDLNIVEDQFELFDVTIEPIKIMHGQLPIFGYKFKSMAYITDAKYILEEEREQLRNLDFLIINCLRGEIEHHSHLILPETLAIIEDLKPKKSYLVHISHHLGFHEVVQKLLPKDVFLAYDGLEVEF